MFCELCASEVTCTLVFLPLNQTVKNKQIKEKKRLVCEFDHGPFKQFVHMLQNCKIWALFQNDID